MSLSKLQETVKDRGAWQTTVHGVTKESDTTERLTLAKHFLMMDLSPVVFSPSLQCRYSGNILSLLYFIFWGGKVEFALNNVSFEIYFAFHLHNAARCLPNSPSESYILKPSFCSS